MQLVPIMPVPVFERRQLESRRNGSYHTFDIVDVDATLNRKLFSATLSQKPSFAATCRASYHCSSGNLGMRSTGVMESRYVVECIAELFEILGEVFGDSRAVAGTVILGVMLVRRLISTRY